MLLRRFFHSSALVRPQGAVAGTGIALDIDGSKAISGIGNPPPIVIVGVLIRGGNVLPSTKRALRALYGENALGKQFPVVFLTNGGGMTEEQKARQLSEKFGIAIQSDQVVMCHSPLKEWVKSNEALRKGHVLAVGQNSVKEVALSYGMENPVLVEEVARWNPSIWPFRSYPKQPAKNSYNFDSIAFQAIVVLHDSIDWGQDTQVCCDLLRSEGGVLGSLSPFHHTPHFKQSIPIYFSNPDYIWSNEFSVPRFGQGGFRKCLESAYEELTGHPLTNVIQFGKPFPSTYQYAETILERQATQKGASLRLQKTTGAKRVFAVGDNIASDITGANHYGWKSILVRTGVFKDDPDATEGRGKSPFVLKPSHHIPPDFMKLPTFRDDLLEPTILCDDIGEAVEHILRNESLEEEK